MLATVRFDSSVSAAIRSSTLPGPLEEPLEDRVRALAEGQRVELVERAEEPAQLGAGRRPGRRPAALGRPRAAR